MLWLEHKYVGLISPRLDRFTRVNQNTYRMRCPLCGDSISNKSKTRGYIYHSKGKLRYHCHNCGVSMGLPFFIKELDPTLYYEYVKENMLENQQQNKEHDEFVKKLQPPKFVAESPLKKLKKISQLQPEHPAKKYVQSRGIPSNYHYKLFYAPKFKEWVNSIIPDKLGEKTPEEPRLIIPFIGKNEQLFGFQGRSFDPNTSLRYITIMLDEDAPRIYNLDSLSDTKTIYVVEGPIDSMFIPNAIATAGGDILTELRLTDLPKERIIIVYDNEPRNPETVKKIAKCIGDGFRVCIWPRNLEHKDINDMIKHGGQTSASVEKIILENSYTGIEANLHLTVWKKC